MHGKRGRRGRRRGAGNRGARRADRLWRRRGPDGRPGARTVKVRTDIYYSGAVLPLVAECQTGIFERHGLRVELNEGKDSGTTIQTVGNGSGRHRLRRCRQPRPVGRPGRRREDGRGDGPAVAAGAVRLRGLRDQDPGTWWAGPRASPPVRRPNIFPAYANATGIDERTDPVPGTSTSPPAPSCSWPGRPTSPSGCSARAGRTSRRRVQVQAGRPALPGRRDLDVELGHRRRYGLRRGAPGSPGGSSPPWSAVNHTNADTPAAVDAFYRFAPTSKVPDRSWPSSGGSRRPPADPASSGPVRLHGRQDWASTIALTEQYGGVDRAGSRWPTSPTGSARPVPRRPEPGRDRHRMPGAVHPVQDVERSFTTRSGTVSAVRRLSLDIADGEVPGDRRPQRVQQARC
ncbi:hypothetical protein HBB16_07165 [Pseudonocardia sp. MCCB 268]|nr:hypothetical protein [Pseudonocardia cytotoxica]